MPKWNECLTDEGVVFMKNRLALDKKLVLFEHNEKSKCINICFLSYDKKGKLEGQEELIMEDWEFYAAIKDWLVKFPKKKGE